MRSWPLASALAPFGLEAAGCEGEPRLGPDAVPPTEATEYLRACFNQGVLTGDRDGSRIPPIGAFDGANGRVLVMDVDRRRYLPSRSTDAKLLAAMPQPAPAEHGPLQDGTSGLVRVEAPPRG
jgi:hypothetical protein